jgi:hypothetical protein
VSAGTASSSSGVYLSRAYCNFNLNLFERVRPREVFIVKVCDWLVDRRVGREGGTGELDGFPRLYGGFRLDSVLADVTHTGFLLP